MKLSLLVVFSWEKHQTRPADPNWGGAPGGGVHSGRPPLRNTL